MDLVKAHEITKYNFVKFMIRQVQTSTYKLDPSNNEKWEQANLCKYHFLLQVARVTKKSDFVNCDGMSRDITRF